MQRQAQAGVQGIGGTDSWLDTRRDFLTLDRVFGAFVTAFGLFVLAAAAVVVAGSMAARMVERRKEIGLLGAVGFTPRQVSTRCSSSTSRSACCAAIVGWFLAGFLAPKLQLGIGAALGPQGPAWTLLGLVVAALVISVILTLATLVPARRAARRPVTDVIRDAPSERVEVSPATSPVPARLSTARPSRRRQPTRQGGAHRAGRRRRGRGGGRVVRLHRGGRHGEGRYRPRR